MEMPPSFGHPSKASGSRDEADKKKKEVTKSVLLYFSAGTDLSRDDNDDAVFASPCTFAALGLELHRPNVKNKMAGCRRQRDKGATAKGRAVALDEVVINAAATDPAKSSMSEETVQPTTPSTMDERPEHAAAGRKELAVSSRGEVASSRFTSARANNLRNSKTCYSGTQWFYKDHGMYAK